MITPQALLETAPNVDGLSRTEGQIDMVELQSIVLAACHRLGSFVVSLFRLHCQYSMRFAAKKSLRDINAASASKGGRAPT